MIKYTEGNFKTNFDCGEVHFKRNEFGQCLVTFSEDKMMPVGTWFPASDIDALNASIETL